MSVETVSKEESTSLVSAKLAFCAPFAVFDGRFANRPYPEQKIEVPLP
jgi:hypothetical protein